MSLDIDSTVNTIRERLAEATGGFTVYWWGRPQDAYTIEEDLREALAYEPCEFWVYFAGYFADHKPAQRYRIEVRLVGVADL